MNEADRRICYPYVFSNGAYLEGGALTYGPSGVVAWVLASQRPYRYTDDQGALLNRGVRFGDEELSADAIVVPMIGAEGEGLVVGIVGALSDTPGAFTDETVVAMQWLATLVRLSSLSRRCFEIQAMLLTRVGPPSVESSCALAAPGGAGTGARGPNRRTEAGRWSDVRGDLDRSAVRSVTSAHGLWRAGLLGGTVRP